MYFVYVLAIVIFGIIGWTLADGKSKTNYVRLIDIFIYGPYLLYLAYRLNNTGSSTYTSSRNVSKWDVWMLLILGATTMTYNTRNLGF